MLVKWSCWTMFAFFGWSNILFPSISIYFHIFGPKIPSSVSWISIFHGKSPFLLVNNKLFHGKSAIFPVISYESIIFSMVFAWISHESIIFSMLFPWISHVSWSTLYRPANAVHAEGRPCRPSGPVPGVCHRPGCDQRRRAHNAGPSPEGFPRKFKGQI